MTGATPTPRGRMPEIIDVAGIAQLLGVRIATVLSWRNKRRILPEDRGVISGKPYWYKSDIVKWARQTGRWGRRRVGPWDDPALPEDVDPRQRTA